MIALSSAEAEFYALVKAASTAMGIQSLARDFGDHYEIELGKSTNLPAWDDDMYNGNPASSVLSDFRDFVQRTKSSL